MKKHEITSRAEWLKHRTELLEQEKAFTRAKDELAKARRELPWVRVEKEYVFETPSGRASLGDLFGTRSQLLVYHLMFGPNAEAACKSCSFWADNFNPAVPHLLQRDVSLVAISRAPLAKLEAFKKRLGWSFPWVSSGGTDFNFDFGASFRDEDRKSGATYNYAPLGAGMPSDLPGFSVFYKDPNGAIFHTYSTYGRGIELVNGTYQLLDLVPKGRDEDDLPKAQTWVRYHDEYPTSA
jgi:predicted dithiol-disulfide oxidoreductase (DUF899 family)